MIEKQFLANEEKKLSLLNAEKDTIFWFDIDIVELGLLNRTYGREKGNLFLSELEGFIERLPGIISFLHLNAGHFVFDLATQLPCDEHEIVRFWKDNVKKFTDAQQKLYPEYSIHISCGICPFNGSDRLRDVFENAVLARKESRNSKMYMPVVYTPELLEGLSVLHKREVNIRKALSDERFTFYLQPIVDLKSGCVVAAEALARGISPEGEIKYPDSFLPIMEHNGSVIELDYLILRKVCRALRERIDEGKKIICTSVNLSRAHLQDDTTADTLLSIVNEYGIDHKLINFEITETLPVDEFSNAKSLIDDLRTQGFGVSIDDYGSGYTGITIWQDLDFDVLKMDRKFLDGNEAVKRRNRVLIPNTINLAKQLDICVVCEGVECVEQCDTLREWGCDTAQGYYFSYPIPADSFYRKLEANNGIFPLTI